MNNSSSCDVNATIALHSYWIYVSFGDCVVNVRQYFSFVVGLISIISWLFALVPQIIVNCKTGEADKSLSFWFLLLWFFSDSCNFIGALLTNQLITQILLAAYFVLIDAVSFIQFLFHFFRNRGVKGVKKAFYLKSCYGSVLVLLLPCALLIHGFYSPWYHFSSAPGEGEGGGWKSRALLETTDSPIIDGHDKEFITGYVLGWISAVVYFFALPPQIIKNFRRHSVEGVSLLMFMFVTIGDSTYVISVLLFSVDKVFIVRTLPWLLGAAWSVIFDVFLVVQIIGYKCLAHRRKRKKHTNINSDMTQNHSSEQKDYMSGSASLEKVQENPIKILYSK